MSAGARIFQFDVGDGQFVQPITIGPIVLKSISPLVHELGGVLDCHLMVVSPEKHFEAIARGRRRQRDRALRGVRRPAGVIAAGARARARRRRRVQPRDRAGRRWRRPRRRSRRPRALHEHPPGLLGPAVHARSRSPRVRRLRELLPDDVYIQVDGGVGPDNVRRAARGRREPARRRDERLRPRGIAARVPATSPRSDARARASSSPSAGEGRRIRTRSSARSSSRGGEVVGEGWHERPGGPHAEVVALGAAGERARGATLYVDARAVRPPRHARRRASTRSSPPGSRSVVVGAQDPTRRRDGVDAAARGRRRGRAVDDLWRGARAERGLAHLGASSGGRS